MFAAPIGSEQQTKPTCAATVAEILSLSGQTERTLQRHLTSKIKDAISSLQLLPGQLLPSTRELADEMRISRATVVRVYRDLVSQNYLEAVEGVGTFVRRRLSIDNAAQSPPCEANAIDCSVPSVPLAKPETLPAELLPIKQWKRILLDRLRTLENALDANDMHPFGSLMLRQAISAYLSRSRQINSAASNIYVSSNDQLHLAICANALLRNGQRIAVPECLYPNARKILERTGAEIISIPIDEEGIQVCDVEKLDPAPSCVYVNSSHAMSNGACMSLSRRKQLLQWAAPRSVVIIEDDFDAEFRLAGPVLPPLRSLTSYDGIIYLSSFTRALYPLIKLSYMVVPQFLLHSVLDAVNSCSPVNEPGYAFFDHYALAGLLDEGFLERFILDANHVLASRWRSCVYELTRNFGRSIKISKESSATQLSFRLPGELDHCVTQAALSCGLRIESTSSFYADCTHRNEYTIDFATLQEDDLAARVAAFHDRVTRQSEAVPPATTFTQAPFSSAVASP